MKETNEVIDFTNKEVQRAILKNAVALMHELFNSPDEMPEDKKKVAEELCEKFEELIGGAHE